MARSSSMIAPRIRDDRVRLELDRALDVELLDRVDETEDPVGHEVGLLDVRRQADADPAGDVFDERRVVQDQALARGRVRRLLEVLPQPAQSCLVGRDGVDVRCESVVVERRVGRLGLMRGGAPVGSLHGASPLRRGCRAEWSTA